MEEYLMMRDNSTSRANFPFGSPNSSAGFARNTSNANPNTQSLPNNGFNHQSNGWFLSEIPVNVKIEGSNSQSLPDIKYASERGSRATTQLHEHANFCNDDALKAKILNHPQYTNLLGAYIDCQKVGAPAEVVARLTAVAQEFEKPSAPNCMNISTDPELDQFMEAYCNMLMKYRDELTKPLQEAMDFIRKVETQLSCLNNGSVRVTSSEVKCEGGASSEEDIDGSGGESELPEIDPRAEDRELKNHLLKKYSGYLSNLKQEFSKKRKKGKLPKEARQKLLNWWEIHYKWPYPSETEKMALAESTGLDQKQINNWFINQRKRHWKPPEDMQFVVMDGYHPHNTAMYMDGHFIGEGPYRFGP